MINKPFLGKLTALGLTIFLSLSISFFFAPPAEALAPFGGLVSFSLYCPCSHNLLLYVSPPVGGWFTYRLGTQAYESYNLGFQTGIWALGLYSPSEGCWFFNPGEGCYRHDARFGMTALGSITSTVGTSLTF